MTTLLELAILAGSARVLWVLIQVDMLRRETGLPYRYLAWDQVHERLSFYEDLVESGVLSGLDAVRSSRRDIGAQWYEDDTRWRRHLGQIEQAAALWTVEAYRRSHPWEFDHG